MERTFAEGVGRALRQARAKGVAVTIQDREGRLVSGEVRERKGVFSITEASSSRKKDLKSTEKGESARKR
jgi:hypothetical protein